MKKAFVPIFLLFILLFAAATTFSHFYLDKEDSNIINKKLFLETRELCFKAFFVMNNSINFFPKISEENTQLFNLLDSKAYKK